MEESSRSRGWGRESNVTSHEASPCCKDGLPTGAGMQAGPLSSAGIVCFQILTSRSFVVEESSNLSQLEYTANKLIDNLCSQIFSQKIIYARCIDVLSL